MPFLLVRMPFASALEGKAKDFTGDGKVDMKDIGLVIKAVEPSSLLLAIGDSIYDLDGDGVVTLNDVAIEAAAFGFIFHLFNLSKWDSIFRMPKFEIAGLANKVASTSDGLEWNVTASGAVMRQWMINHDSRSFPIETANLDFYYQPPLDQELNVSEYDFVNATHAIKDDIVMVERPINVVGSYAVYSTTKRDNEYGTGQLFMIYRPLLVDAVGATSWGWMNISGDTFTIGWNSSWVAACTFPLTIDPTFGYETAGGTSTSVSGNELDSVQYNCTSPGAAGTATSLSFYVRSLSGTKNCKGILILNSTRAIQANGVGGAVAVNTTADWRTSTFATPPTVTSSTLYQLGWICDANYVYLYYNTAGAGATDSFTDASNNYATPTDPTDQFKSQRRYSIYCTYVTETVPPTYTLSATPYNATAAASVCNFSCQWSDVSSALSMATLWTNNTGLTAGVNETWLTLSGLGPVWANFTVTLNSTAGYVVAYQWFCNDSANNFNSTTIAYLTLTGAYPTMTDFTVSSGATAYAYQTFNVTVTLMDLDGAYAVGSGLKNCTVSFNQSGVDLRWNATGNATDMVDASNYAGLLNNWTVTVNSTAVNVTWNVQFYWNATETAYGLDSDSIVFDIQGNNGTTTTGSFTFEDDLIVKATPTFNETRSDPSSSVLLSGQLYYQGTTTAPYSTSGIVVHCELNGTSEGSNSSIGVDGAFQISVTSEASPLGNYVYTVYSLTDQTSTTNQTASFILDRIEIWVKDDPIVSGSDSQPLVSETTVMPNFLLAILLILMFAGLSLGYRRFRRSLTLMAASVLVCSLLCVTFNLAGNVAYATGDATTTTFYMRSAYPTHDQPWSEEWPEDTGHLNFTGASSLEERHCTNWVQYWVDEDRPVDDWNITLIYWHIYCKLTNNAILRVGYQCNGTYDGVVDSYVQIGTGTGSYVLYTITQEVNIKPPNIAYSYNFTLKIIDYNGYGNVSVTSDSSEQSYATFTYSAVNDVVNPTYSLPTLRFNSSTPSTNCMFSCLWNDDNNISAVYFSHNNTGAWSYNNSVTLSGYNETASWGNYTVTLNSTQNQVVGYYWIATDIGDTPNWNTTMPIQTLTIKATSVPVDTYVVIWFMARYEYESVAYTNASGSTLSVNGTSATYDSTNDYWWVNVTQSVSGTYTYTVSAVADSTYGLTTINDAVGSVIVEWYSPAFEASITVVTTTHSWSLTTGQSNITLTEATINITVTANRDFNVQAKSLNATLANGTNTIAIGNVLMGYSDLATAISMTTEYQNIPDLTNLQSGSELAITFVLWLSCPLGTARGDYVYTLSIQVTDAT